MSVNRAPLEWKEGGAATNREPDRKCLNGFAPTLTTTYYNGKSHAPEPARVAIITPLPHGDSRRPRVKFFLQFAYRGRTGKAPGTLTTAEFKTLKAAKRKAERLHAELLAYEMQKFLEDDTPVYEMRALDEL